MIQSLLLAKEDREKRIALLQRLGLASHKPDGILRKPGEAKRTAFEEIFGPVLSVTKFKDDEEALSIANDSL